MNWFLCDCYVTGRSGYRWMVKYLANEIVRYQWVTDTQSRYSYVTGIFSEAAVPALASVEETAILQREANLECQSQRT
jgi:hypothetical protein